MRIPIAKEGFPIIISILTAGLIIGSLNLFFGLPLIAFGIFSLWFFRDPEREVPFLPKAIVSPADGRVIKIEELNDERFLKAPAKKVSIFMSVFNVHVNRIPYDGVVEDIYYNPGKFFVASLDKASDLNEQNAVVIRTDDKGKIAFVQIAGLVARRIVCRLSKGDSVRKGERFGMIKFGSRLDVYMPENVQVAVTLNQKVKAGVSVIGYFL